MAITRWHYGKLIILWAWGLLLTALALYGLEYVSGDQFILGTALLLAIIGIPLVLSAITWRWLSGKEKEEA